MIGLASRATGLSVFFFRASLPSRILFAPKYEPSFQTSDLEGDIVLAVWLELNLPRVSADLPSFQ